MKRFSLLAIAFVALFSFNACKKQIEGPTAPLSDYFPLQTGKYITYNLDSTTYTNFGARPVITHYQVQYYTDSTITDNEGRTAYRIIRYIRDSSSGTWVADNTFMALNTGNTIQWVENNLRFVKLVLPIEEGV